MIFDVNVFMDGFLLDEIMEKLKRKCVEEFFVGV